MRVGLRGLMAQEGRLWLQWVNMVTLNSGDSGIRVILAFRAILVLWHFRLLWYLLEPMVIGLTWHSGYSGKVVTPEIVESRVIQAFQALGTKGDSGYSGISGYSG